jgi:hypothetical protein
MLTFDVTDHYAFTGYWTNIYSGIVFADKDGNSGSLYRDMYDDDKDYCKRSALHSEVIPLIQRLLKLEENEERLARLGIHPLDYRMARLRKSRQESINELMQVHLLTTAD